MSTLFTRIINGEIPCYKIAENNLFIAFLDILPVAKGHTLVVPKKEIDYIFDLPNEELQALNLFAKEVARKIQAKNTLNFVKPFQTLKNNIPIKKKALFLGPFL
jgi:histidine triad (HIT) family protein